MNLSRFFCLFTVLLCCSFFAVVSASATASTFHSINNKKSSPSEHRRQLVRSSSQNLLGSKVPCVCANTSLCNPLQTPLPQKEFLMFQTNATNWRTYDWKYVTSIALFGGYDPEMLCVAHEHGVRVLFATDGITADQLTNQTARDVFSSQAVQTVMDNGWDGINLDFEYPTPNELEPPMLVMFAFDMFKKLKVANFHSSFSMDLAWSPNDIDGRNYDYDELIRISDFVVVMDYDTRSQVFQGPPCFAGPNSPASTLFGGIDAYNSLSAGRSDKLILGLPFYGYEYPCLNANSLNFEQCEIPSVPFRGCKCSDAAGAQIIFSDIMDMVRNSSITHTPVITNTDMNADAVGSFATFNVKLPDAQWKTEYKKLYFDNPATLSEKYAAAKKLELRGLAIWSIDMIYTDGGKESERDAKAMWDAFANFL